MQQRIKRIFDFMIALIGIIIASPILLIVAILVRLNLGAPILFRQPRVGLNGEVFEMVKFRTMKDAKDAKGHLLPDDERLTKFGQFLRQSSLDELPELFNVLKGDMSLVGPRPLLVEYLPLYSKEQARRHEVRPGITGWAQCHGRNAISWKKKFELDVWYVDHISFMTDCKVIFTTIKKVVCREDINSATAATMEPFNGNN